jgi:amidase
MLTLLMLNVLNSSGPHAGHLCRIAKHVDELLGRNAFLTLPSAPGPAPLKGLPADELNEFRNKALALTCIAGLCGLPQVSLPCALVDGLPVGLGIIGPRGSDLQLLALTRRLSGVLLV